MARRPIVSHELGENIPRRNGTITQKIGAFIATSILGWHVQGPFPNLKKFVLIGGPHTSNWDGIIAFPIAFALDLKVNVMAKDSLFRWPFGGFIRYLGMIPIDRTKNHGLVQQVIEQFEQKEKFIIAIPPEGKRAKVDKWKSGFWYIARGANVPIVTVTFDFPSKTFILHEAYEATDDKEADIAYFESLFDQVTPKRPERW